jgi:hypothetical protein
MSHEFNFVHENVTQEDVELLLGPMDSTDGPFIKFDSNWNMSHIMHAAGIFRSVNEARKNGWANPIPKGFQALTVSKRKIKIFVLNEYEE